MRLYDMFDQNNTMNGQQAQDSALAFDVSPTSFMNGSPLNLTSTNVVTAKLEQLLLELDRLIRTSGISTCALLPPNHDICLLMRQIPLLITQSPTPLQTMLTFVEKVVYMLYKSNTNFALEAYTGFLQSLFEMSVDVAKEALLWIVYSEDERKYNAPVIAMLIRHELVPLEEYDIYLAKHVRNNQEVVIQFAVDLLSICLLSPSPITFLEDHTLTLAALKERTESNATQFMEQLKKLIGAPYQSKEKPAIECLDLRMLLAEWFRLCQHPMAGHQLYRDMAKKVQETVKDRDDQCYFFRVCVDTCVDHFLSFKALSATFQKRALQLIDSFGKLVAYMVKVEKDLDKKIALASRAFSVVILVLAQHHEARGTNFNQKPFLRILSSLYLELSKIRINQVHAGIVKAFCDALYTLQPMQFPGFAFSWLQLISHRAFVPELLANNDRYKGWLMCQKLVLALLRFLGPLLDRQILQKATRQFYRGTLRFLVVLLHDFPEFLCEHYMVFVQVIPHSCIQLRNLVLSAFPRVMHLPDPFTPDLRLDRLPEFKQDPVLVMSYIKALGDDFRSAIDNFCQTENNAFYTMALERLSADESGDVMGAFVLYIGSKNAASEAPIENIPATRAYKKLLHDLPCKGRYLLLNAIADHLRYPNNHTYYFSTLLLHLFFTQPEALKEQITRVLLERLIVNRPHPWGLLATFISLIKNPDFWKHDFIRCAPDIERLFDNVSRSIKRTV